MGRSCVAFGLWGAPAALLVFGAQQVAFGWGAASCLWGRSRLPFMEEQYLYVVIPLCHNTVIPLCRYTIKPKYRNLNKK
ncbi:MAG TPA: hypothetical protein ENK85_08830 [Saprospiraceae bacterium]|nr:hypothetical protein [Saprospiraceae bacterium]